jgi:hypothetical protein
MTTMPDGEPMTAFVIGSVYSSNVGAAKRPSRLSCAPLQPPIEEMKTVDIPTIDRHTAAHRALGT